eukprot:scaffold85808_cov29-Tisochrysis_lutea.AAC.1
MSAPRGWGTGVFVSAAAMSVLHGDLCVQCCVRTPRLPTCTLPLSSASVRSMLGETENRSVDGWVGREGGGRRGRGRERERRNWEACVRMHVRACMGQ